MSIKSSNYLVKHYLSLCFRYFLNLPANPSQFSSTFQNKIKCGVGAAGVARRPVILQNNGKDMHYVTC